MRFKHLLRVLAPYVLHLILAGAGLGMPDDTSIKIYLSYGCYILAGLVLCWAIYKDVKSYLQKRKDRKTKKEPSSQKAPEYDILDDCIWEESPGWFINPKTKEKFCYDCWQPPRRVKQYLKKKSLSEWFCPKCKRLYESRLTMWKGLAGVK